eukprot:scaffold11894_cov148-Isochrysis_galbana.AAC.4
MVSSLDGPSAKSAERAMVGRVCVSSDNSAMKYVFVVEVKVFRRKESVGVGRANSLPIELNIGGDMTKSGRPFLNTRWSSGVSPPLKENSAATGKLHLLDSMYLVFGAPLGG